MNYRQQLANKYLVGNGVEFGALHNPLQVDSSQANVLYADKFSKQKLIKLFPELKQVATDIVETDIYFDLNQGLKEYCKLQKHALNCNFYIANHVIEHLINPLRFLDNLHLIMKDGDRLYLALPDKEYTFDRNRTVTTWEHLYKEYSNNTARLSEAHIREFIFNVIPLEHRQEYYSQLRKNYQNWFKRQIIKREQSHRSIHVHVWNQKSFDSFLNKAIKTLKLNFKILEKVNSQANKHEMIYILQKEL